MIMPFAFGFPLLSKTGKFDITEWHNLRIAGVHVHCKEDTVKRDIFAGANFRKNAKTALVFKFAVFIFASARIIIDHAPSSCHA